MPEVAAMTQRLKLGIDERGLCSQPENLDKRDSFLANTATERREARNLCGSLGQENACPVRELCLKWALEHKEIWGVWGGLDESELRRTLWVDAQGHSKPRCRYPNCPNCKARPSRLRITQELDSTVPTVTCIKCKFSWKSRTSALAVKAYQRDRRRRQVQARVPRGRIPGVLPVVRPLALPTTPVEEPGDGLALVAGGG